MTVKPGDVFECAEGVEGTPIPVGAIVRHYTGVDQRRHDSMVRLHKGRKVLGAVGWGGWGWLGGDRTMTVLSLPARREG